MKKYNRKDISHIFNTINIHNDTCSSGYAFTYAESILQNVALEKIYMEIYLTPTLFLIDNFDGIKDYHLYINDNSCTTRRINCKCK